MELERLDIQNFRGVKGTYEFEPDGGNAIIVGPNGSGKSSLLEAIDFLLRDKITHLTGEGMGVVKEDEVIPNVNTDGDCVVRGVFQDPDTGAKEKVVRDFDSRDLDPPEEDLPDSLQRTIDAARRGQHILTRADLLDLVLAQPNSRREVLSKLLDLPEIDERRLALKRTRKNLESKLQEAKASREAVAERLRDTTGAETASPPELQQAALDTINELRDQFGGAPVADIDSNTVREGIKSPASAVATEALQRERPRKELDDFTEWLGRVEDELPPLANELRAYLEEFRTRERVEIDTKQLELLELGEGVIPPDADACPLCQQSWNEDTPLLEDVRERQENLRELQELRQNIAEKRDKIRELFRDGSDHLKYLLTELDEGTYSEVESLETIADDLETCNDTLSGEVLGLEAVHISNLPLFELEHDELSVNISEVVEAAERLETKAERLADLSEVESNYERIKAIADQWEDVERMEERVSQLHSLHEDAKTAESSFNSARKTVIGDIYADIAARVEKYYNRIHPDESGTSSSFHVTDTGVKLNKEFYGVGEYPPQAIHSEGHLDSLGLCLHLALTDYIQREGEAILLLDDVVMSVDQDHRLEVAQLLADEFSRDYQIIVTTHDELWAEQLRSQGTLRGGTEVWFREWSLDNGITESRIGVNVTEQWERVETAIDADEMERAAHELRYATEKMLEQTALSLDAKIEYDPRQRYTLEDYKKAVCRTLDELTSEAKRRLDQHGENADVWQSANELDNRYGKVLQDVSDKLKKVNRRVHWTPGKWLTIRPKEFREVFELHKEAYETLYCDECESSLRYENFDDDYHELRCNCREHYDIVWD